MSEIIEVITNNGIGIACVIYLMYFQLTTSKEMTSTMQEMTRTLEGVNVRLSMIEDKLYITKGN